MADETGRPAALLRDLLGAWAVDRRIDDRKGRESGHFEGRADFVAASAGAVHYREQGVLHLPGRVPMRADRRHVWRPCGDEIEVLFADGRAFHRFDPAGRAAAEHVCAPDLYRVRYDFDRWPLWTSTWTVSGPRKDYTMTTRYRRG